MLFRSLVITPPPASPWGLGSLTGLSADGNVIVTSDGIHIVRYERVEGVWGEGSYTGVSGSYSTLSIEDNGATLYLADESNDTIYVYKFGDGSYYPTATINPALVFPVGSSMTFATSETRLFVGIPKASGLTTLTGAVIVYYENEGVITEGPTLLATDNLSDDEFGKGVAISADGNYVVISSNSGIYMYSSVEGVIDSGIKITSLDPTIANAGYGSAIAINADGTRVVVTAPMDINNYGYQAGAAVVMERVGTVWAETKVLRSSKSASNDRFGSTVDISSDGELIVIGSPDDYLTGSAYLFK